MNKAVYLSMGIDAEGNIKEKRILVERLQEGEGITYSYKISYNTISINNNKMILEHSTIKFKVSGVDIQFDIWHNLPDTFGLSITDAVNSWVYRTNDYSSKSFCEYVLEKDSTLICVDKKK